MMSLVVRAAPLTAGSPQHPLSPMPAAHTYPAYTLHTASCSMCAQCHVLQACAAAVAARCPQARVSLCRLRTDMGGPGAERSAEQGAFSVLWSLEHAGPGSHGGFFRDGVAMEW